MEFSLKSIRACSGNGLGDLPYVRFFSLEAVSRATEAARKVSAIANHEDRPVAMLVKVEDAMLEIVSLYDSVADLETFFKAVPALQKPLTEAKERIDGIQSGVIGDYRRVQRWAESVKSLGS